MSRSNLSRDTIEAVLQVALALEADHLFGDLTLVEHQERRNSSNAVLSGELLLFVNVDLRDLHSAIIFLGQLIKDRPDHFAGPAPFGPKIHQNWHVGAEDFGA